MTDEVKLPAPDTPEYAAAMEAKLATAGAAVDAAVAPEDLQAAAPAEPAGVEADAPKEGAEDAPKEGAEAKPEGEAKEQAEKAAEAAGVKYDDLQAEYDEKGELSEESYKKLEAAGFPKEVVDSFIAGQQALREQVEARGFEAAGGREQFGQMQEWAKGALTKAEIEAYNKAIVGTEEEMLQAVRGLRSRFETEYGRQPQLLGGAPAGTNSGYASRAEMTADMRDPRYAKDPAFRAKVAAKVALTTSF